MREPGPGLLSPTHPSIHPSIHPACPARRVGLTRAGAHGPGSAPTNAGRQLAKTSSTGWRSVCVSTACSLSCLDIHLLIRPRLQHNGERCLVFRLGGPAPDRLRQPLAKHQLGFALNFDEYSPTNDVIHISQLRRSLLCCLDLPHLDTVCECERDGAAESHDAFVSSALISCDRYDAAPAWTGWTDASSSQPANTGRVVPR